MRRIISLTLALLLLTALAGCTAYNYAPTETLFTPGTYEVTVQGHNGPVTVQTTVDKNRVTKIEVTAHDESASVGDTAMQATADAIIAKQGFDVDIVSGATYSCVALIEAVSTALRNAGGTGEIITMDSLDPPSHDVDTGDFPAPPYKAGIYTASANGFAGEVTVTVELSEDAIVSVTAEGAAETAGIGTRAIDELPGAIIEAGNTGVDIVSGATVTSAAILQAVVDAVGKAK